VQKLVSPWYSKIVPILDITQTFPMCILWSLCHHLDCSRLAQIKLMPSLKLLILIWNRKIWLNRGRIYSQQCYVYYWKFNICIFKTFSEFGNVLAFGYRLPQKSYAIFRLPAPPANPAQAGVIVINLLFSLSLAKVEGVCSLTAGQNKLECLSLTNFQDSLLFAR
jgi:hypothetical protein